MKRRFGISLPEPVASKLDELALNTNSDRSTIVAKAIEEYLHEDLHETREHLCSGLIILVSEKPLSQKGVEDSVVKAQFTVSARSAYITVLFVEGFYERVKKLRRTLSRKCSLTRYIPLLCVYEGGSGGEPR